MTLRFLLDTDTAITVLRNRPAVAKQYFADHSGQLAISTVSAFELWYGAERSSNTVRNRKAVDEFLSLLQILDFDLQAASQAADIRAELAAIGTPIGAYDLLIASIARANGLTVVTGNTRKFIRVSGLRVTNWLA